MILYPTETIYGLGVNALDAAAVARLFALKGRVDGKAVSWLVRDVSDIARFGELSPTAAKIAQRFLPGPLTLVLPAKESVSCHTCAPDGTLSFRISSDVVAQQLIADFMAEHNAPLTCTSANVSGAHTCATPAEIIAQFAAAGQAVELIERVVDDGPRSGPSSTVVRVIGDTIDILREGAVSSEEIKNV